MTQSRVPLSSRLQPIRDCLDRIGYGIEHGFVLTLEGLTRVLGHFDPRTYLERQRIVSIIPGSLPRKSDKFVVLTLFLAEQVPGFTSNFIEAIRQSQFNVVIVSNNRLLPSVRAALLEKCLALVERNNVGRDFGGYQDGISVVSRLFGPIERLVIANDSVFYLRDGLEAFVSALDGSEDWIGVSEVFEYHYHVASFLMSFGRPVLESAAFRRFWSRYRPIGTRRWIIHQGEVKLSEQLVKAGFRPHILYKAEHLRPHLQARPAQQILPLLPARVRARLARTANVEGNGSAGDIGQASADAIVSAILATNQMHAGGLLFQQLLRLPMIKRDVVYRRIHTIEEMQAALAAIEEPLRTEILADLRRRGTPDRMGPWRRLLHRHSAI